MQKIQLRHFETKEYVVALSLNKVHIKLEVLYGFIEEISVIYWKRFFEHEAKTVKMGNFSYEKTSPYYEVILEFEERLRYLNYIFIFKAGNQFFYYGKDGLTLERPNKPFELQYVNEGDIFKVPNWAEGRVGYHIFVDRFNISNQTNKAIVAWNELPDRTKVYGGNLKGVSDKINYLSELGIKMLIFTPIFEGEANHKYDTINYLKIDPLYGRKEDLINLVKKAHQNDIKIVLDGVFNHIGYMSYQFQDVIKKQKKSKYYDWFIIDGEFLDVDSFNYLAVGDYKRMPKLNYQSENLRTFIKKVALYWIKEADIDGWRFDVYDEIDENFRIELATHLKKFKADVLLIGETWGEGSSYLNNNEVHSVMNYLYRDNIINFFIDNKIDNSKFQERVESLMFRYPKPSHNVLYNLLGSHDTKRIVTVANNDFKKIELAYAFLLTTPGMPVIYYGDEVGINGDNDPDCRKTMNWDLIGNEFYQTIKRLISIRNGSKALLYGSLKHVDIDKSLYSFMREYENDRYLIVFNNNDFEIIANLTRFINKIEKLESKSYLIIKI